MPEITKIANKKSYLSSMSDTLSILIYPIKSSINNGIAGKMREAKMTPINFEVDINNLSVKRRKNFSFLLSATLVRKKT